MYWFRKRQLLSVNKKLLSSWNGAFAAKSPWGVSELWGLWHLGDLLTFIKKSLFVDIKLARVFIFFLQFWGNDTLNDELKFYWKKKIDRCSPAKVWSNLKLLTGNHFPLPDFLRKRNVSMIALVLALADDPTKCSRMFVTYVLRRW